MIDFSPIWISLKTAFTATSFTFFLGISAAYWMLGYRGKGTGLIDGFLTSPLVLPPTVVGFLLLLLLGKNSPIGQFLDQLGITIIFTWYATVIASTVVAFPLMYKTTLAAFKQIDPHLIACARTLGASEWVVFWRVLFPLAKPGLIAGTLLSFARALGEFGATLMLAGSIPGKTQTIPIAIFFAAESGEMNQALIWVLIILGISLGITWFVNYRTEKTTSTVITFLKNQKKDYFSSVELRLANLYNYANKRLKLCCNWLNKIILCKKIQQNIHYFRDRANQLTAYLHVKTKHKYLTITPKNERQLLVEIKKNFLIFS